MRMRRKKHLQERLDAVSDYILKVDTSVLDSRECLKFPCFFNFEEIFNNTNSIHLEIGCGKGTFVVNKAIENKNVNFFAVEMLENVVVQAAEKAKKLGLKNVKFLNIGADYLLRYFPLESVDAIYLNFSPPYMQDRYEGRRLTNCNLVKAYKHILKKSGFIYQKTDDKDFFDYSFNSFATQGFKVVDLSNKGIENDVVTEYESKFLALNKKIYKLKAFLWKKYKILHCFYLN